MATDVRDVEQKLKLDENLLAALPEGGRVTSVTPSGLSDYCNTFRIAVEMPNGSSQTFFEKESQGPLGEPLATSAWVSESALYEFIPEYVPRPCAKGTYKSSPDTHFFLAEFVDLLDTPIPSPESYMAAVVALHKRSMGNSPTGKFGFAVNTRFGDLEQHNGWSSSWEEFWTMQMREFLEREERVAGPHDAELVQLKDVYFNKVLPRYLRPLESDGRLIQPCLLHADLWPGNVKYNLASDQDAVCIFDASALWGHNEVDLGVFRNPRYPLGKSYLKEYRKHVQVSEPAEDEDSRNLMYMLRNQILLSTLYPRETKLRDTFAGTMRVLCDRVLAEEAEVRKNTNAQAIEANSHLDVGGIVKGDARGRLKAGDGQPSRVTVQVGAEPVAGN